MPQLLDSGVANQNQRSVFPVLGQRVPPAATVLPGATAPKHSPAQQPDTSLTLKYTAAGQWISAFSKGHHRSKRTV